jgi:CBS domain containing-hemolysin-like protein
LIVGEFDFERDLPLILTLAGAFVLSVFIAAAETALLRMPFVRVASLASEGVRGAKRLKSLVDRLPEVLNAILLAALLVQIAAATVTGILADRWFGPLGVTIVSATLTVILFIYSEAIPKTFAVRHADRVALRLALPMAILELVLRPIVKVLVWIADLQMPGKGVIMSPTVTEDELRMLATRAAVEGEITREDLRLIERAFRAGDREVDDIMVPRPDIVAVADDTPTRQALEIALEAGHRRLPLYEGSIENITGVVRIRDLMRVPSDRTHLQVGAFAEEPLVVPESKRILDLLREMQTTHNHVAVVVDEYGGTAGLVTVEDIVEELIGSIQERRVDEEVVSIGEGRWMVDGSVPVEDLEDILGEEVDDTDWNTVAGLTLGLLGRLPAVGDEVEHAGHVLRVVAVRGRRILRVEIRRVHR